MNFFPALEKIAEKKFSVKMDSYTLWTRMKPWNYYPLPARE